MGPPDYWKLAPPHSYIDVNNFTTVKELADYLHHLDVYEEEYLAYFKWKDKFTALGGSGHRNYLYCQLCEKLNNQDIPTKIYKDMRNWFFYDINNSSHCTDPKDRKYFKSLI